VAQQLEGGDVESDTQKNNSKNIKSKKNKKSKRKPKAVEEEIQVADIEVKTEPEKTTFAPKGAAKEERVSTAGIMLALALGVHSLFEGVAFGLMPTVGQMWQLGLGIFIHKACGSVALGSKLFADGASRN